MSTEEVIFVAGVVGCVALCAGVIVTLVAWAVVGWLRSGREPGSEPGHADEAAREAEARIAAVHRQAHETLATSVLRGTGEHAAFDDLLRASRDASGHGVAG